MRKSFWIGLVLLVLGLVVALRGASYNDKKAEINIGELEAKVVERETVPSWIGWAAAGAGVVLMVTGFRRRAST